MSGHLRSRMRVVALVMGAIVGGCVLPAAAKAAPANDDFANAQTISSTVPFSVSGTNVGATAESGEPSHFGSSFIGPKRSVWFRWTPTASELVRLEVCNFESPGGGTLTYFPSIGLYTGTSVDSLTPVKPPAGCAMTLHVIAGTEYMIAIDATEEGSFNLRSRVDNPPTNDDFANAASIGHSLSTTAYGSTADATDEPGDPAGANLSTVWFDWTPTSSGRVTLDLCDGSRGLLLALRVFTGSQIGSLSQQAASGGECRVSLDVTGGTDYKLEVYSGYYQETSFYLDVTPAIAPANDNLVDAQVVPPDLPAQIQSTNRDATAESGEPNHFTRFDGHGALASVWFQWTAGFSGFVHVDACNSYEYKGVAVYTGSTIAGLNRLASSGQDCLIYFSAVAGQTYKIAVDSYPSEEDQFTLKLHHMSPPANDDFANATTVGPDLPLSVPATSVDSTGEADEPNHADSWEGARASTWFDWTPDGSGQASIDVCDGGAEAVAVYTGTQVNALTEVAKQRSCTLTLDASSGVTYRIAVEDARYQGPYTLDIHSLNRPANDAFSDAQVLPAMPPGPVAGATQDATYEPDEAGGSGGQYGYGNVWYRWTPGSSEDVAVKLCDAPTTAFRVLTGSSVNSLDVVVDYREDCIAHFHATAGVTYSIMVNGRTNVGADFTLDVHTLNPPSNDDFADAIPIGSLPTAIPGSTVDAGREQHEFDDYGQSVWYRWTPTQSMGGTIDTCHSDFDTYLAVYTGVSRISDFDNFGSFSLSGWSDDGCGDSNPQGSSTQIVAIAGHTY
jgi:hypothetical protein